MIKRSPFLFLLIDISTLFDIHNRQLCNMIMEFWRRHKKKVYVTFGIISSGFVLYKLYDGHRRRISELEKELEADKKHDELIRAQMKEHFERIQMVAYCTSLPHAMQHLSSKIAEELDLMQLTEKLMKGKEHPSSLTPTEKLELWDRLKILSFTRMVLSLWAMTALNLYIRVQVNILGRHLYIDAARGLQSSNQHEADLLHKDEQKLFLSSADYLANNGLITLVSRFETTACEALKGKQLKDVFSSMVLRDTIDQILDGFMSQHWLCYLIPEMDSHGEVVRPSNFEQLMIETHAVVSSAEFGSVLEVSLRAAIDEVVKNLGVECGEDKLVEGMPLAKLLPRLAHLSQQLLDEEPDKNRYIQAIQKLPEVELFFTLLYSSTPVS